MQQILCIEDSPETRTILEASLKAYETKFASTLLEASQMLETQRYDLVILDIGMPDGSGIDFLAQVQEKIEEVPVIFLTGKQDLATKLAAFSLGAEDFILKPFDPFELKIRADARIRKSQKANGKASVLKMGSLVCSADEQRLYKNEGRELIDLTAIEFKIFFLLAKTPNKIFSRLEILERVWGYHVNVTDRAVDVHISNLRRKLAGSDVNIETMVGSGYKISVKR